jgi:hypothetical protein
LELDDIMTQVFVIDDQVFDGLTKEEVKATAEAMKETDCFRLPYNDVKVRISWNVMFRLAGINPGGTTREKLRDDLMCEGVIGLPFPHPGKSGEWVPYGARLQDKLQAAFEKEFPSIPLNEGDPLPDMRNISRCHPIDQRRYQSIRPDENWDWPITVLCPGYPPDPEIIAGTVHNSLRTALIVVLASKGVIKEERKLTGLQRLRRQKLEDGVTITDICLDPRLSIALGGTHNSPRMHLRRGHVRSQHHGSGMTLIKKIFVEPTWVCADADFMVTRTAYTVH